LAETFPSGAFTLESLDFVTRGNEWFPAVAILSPRIAEWWNAHRPQSAPLIRGDVTLPAGWEPRDDNWLRYWHATVAKRREAEIALGAKLATIHPTQHPVARLASLVREQSPLAYRVIAAAEGWPDAAPPVSAEVDPDAVGRVRDMLAAAMTPARPPFQGPKTPDTPAPPPQVKALPLSGLALAEARRQAADRRVAGL